MWTPLLTLAALTALAGCAPPPYTPAEEDTGEGNEAEDTAPGIEFVWPAPEAPVTGCAMMVVEVRNLELTDFMVNTDKVEGQGHYHLLYEDHYLPCATPYCLIALEVEGFNFIEAQLVNNDHSAIVDADDEPIVTNIALNVTAGECSLGTPGAGY